ncbi:MAG: hypothetical protein PHP70_08965 [Gallionella sp.]|nr:hypothetical protein [Gallionella sp.]
MEMVAVTNYMVMAATIHLLSVISPVIRRLMAAVEAGPIRLKSIWAVAGHPPAAGRSRLKGIIKLMVTVSLEIICPALSLPMTVQQSISAISIESSGNPVGFVA